MKQKSLLVALILFLLICSHLTINISHNISQASGLPKFYVDDEYTHITSGWGVDHFAIIQDAIDTADAGDRIVVYEGTYTEQLTIDKKLDLFGENRTTTIINGNTTGTTINITAAFVNISHFTITNSGTNATDSLIEISANNPIITDTIIQNGQQGIHLYNCNNGIIYENTIQNNNGPGIICNQSNSYQISYNILKGNNIGILVYSGDSNTISNNIIQTNTNHGLFLNYSCDSNTLSQNNITSNTENGIFILDNCAQNTISSNQMFTNTGSAIKIENSSSNTISSNTIGRNSQYGIIITGSQNIISANTLSTNTKHGLFLFADDNTTVTQNTITSNSVDGIHCQNSTSDTIYTNTIIYNSRYGLYLDFFTKNNLIYNNLFSNNTQDNAQDKTITMTNRWNQTQTTGSNIIGGSYLGGNYWCDYRGADPNQDGIGSTSYQIYNSVYDYLPLVDGTTPSITSVTRAPTVQTTEGTVIITAAVTDDLHVEDVRLIVTNPIGQTTNISIKQSQSGTTYTSQSVYPYIGTYSFYVSATDYWNWALSSTNSFLIQQGVPPTITDNTASAASPSQYFTFNATVTDDTCEAENITVQVNWTQGTTGENTTLSNTNDDYFEASIHLRNTTEEVTYTLYATDQWGNTISTTQKTITVSDTLAPIIIINKYGPSFETLPGSYTFGATITDNIKVELVTIEYWYAGSSHYTIPITGTQNYYEKSIIPQGTPEKIYCIFYATDPSGNQNNSKAPTAILNDAPYNAVVSVPHQFNASDSFDLDGNISEYSWDFGDGTTDTGKTTNYTYASTGTYTITLTVTDNDENIGSTSSIVTVIPLVKISATPSLLTTINSNYDVTLTEYFYAYDITGDTTVDKFYDPNNVLTSVQKNGITIDNQISFLLSVDDPIIPEFLWNTSTNTITTISYQPGSISETIFNEQDNTATTIITIEKSDGWVYIEAPNSYPEASLTIQKGTQTIDTSMIWITTEKIYVLDDPEQEYWFIYHDYYEPPGLETPLFTPSPEGGVINGDNPTITITYLIPVTILDAAFGDIYIPEEEFFTNDFITYSYTPPHNLEDNTYEFYILVSDDLCNELESTAIYFYFSYEKADEGGMGLPVMEIIGGIICALIGIAVFLIWYKKIPLSFIYIKNRKILPFFKPLVIGPLSIHIDNKQTQKAEFYVDGSLQHTITQSPFLWKYNETGIGKHIIETKIYDNEGKSNTSGTMEVYNLNSTKLFR